MTDTLEPAGERPHDAASRAAALADVPLVSPAPMGGLRGILNHRYLLKLLVKREVTARYTGSFLGMLWSYINPLTQFLMYMFIFALIGRGMRILATSGACCPGLRGRCVTFNFYPGFYCEISKMQ